MEQHQELMDKFIVERQAEADDLRMQHEKDIAECRKTIIEEYDAKINELEQNQESESVRLKEEMAKIVPAVADESPVLDSQEPVDEPDQDVNKNQDGGSTEGGDDLPSDPEVVKQRSSAEMDDSIEDLPPSWFLFTSWSGSSTGSCESKTGDSSATAGTILAISSFNLTISDS
jgi:hypothetical protein